MLSSRTSAKNFRVRSSYGIAASLLLMILPPRFPQKLASRRLIKVNLYPSSTARLLMVKSRLLWVWHPNRCCYVHAIHLPSGHVQKLLQMCPAGQTRSLWDTHPVSLEDVLPLLYARGGNCHALIQNLLETWSSVVLAWLFS